MADTKSTVALEIKVNGEAATASVGSFKKQLKDANNELLNMSAKFGETSKEAVNAAQKVAKLKDSIGDAKALADTFNPDKKFVALGGALQGVVAGFTAVQGAMGLFGSESKDVEKAMLKVQSAMALQQGISGIFDAIDSFKLLGASVMRYSIVQKIVTAGQRLFNAVMSANPIGLLITAITALIASGYALYNFFSKLASANKENEKAVNDHSKALDNQIKTREKSKTALNDSIAQELAMAKATGKSTSAIRALELQLIQKSLADTVASRTAAMHTIELEKQTLASLKSKDANEDTIKKQLETTNKAIAEYNKLNQNVQTTLDERKKIINRHEVEVAQEKTNLNSKAKADNDKSREDTKAKLDKENIELRDRNLLAIEENKQFAKNDLETIKGQDIIKKDLKIQMVGVTNQAILDSTKKSAFEIAAMEKAVKDQELEDNKIIQDAKIKATLDTLNIVSDILGKESAAGKAMAISMALINTYQGIAAGVKLGFPLAIPAVLAAAATGFKAVKSIIATKVPGGGGSGGGSAPSMGSIAAPIKPEAQTTTLSTQSINQIGVASSRAFVLETDVTNNQERIQRLNRAARINTILILVMSFITHI